MARILVTGANGFIGRHLVPVLMAQGHRVVEAGRRPRADSADFFEIGEIGAGTDWRTALAGCDAVVHLAAVAHRGDSEYDEETFFEVNDRGTDRLVEQATAVGVATFVLVSSIAAREGGGSAYARSKRAAEAHMKRFAEGGGNAVVLRPPLVYAHDAPGNWRRLQRLAATSLPLPFARVTNRRSLCSVGNLCSAIAAAVEAVPGPPVGSTYEIADAAPVSLPDIIAFLRVGMGRPRRLLPVPTGLLRLALGRRRAAQLLDDLVLDPTPFMRAFGWSPPEAAPEAIERSGRLYSGRGERET